MPTVNSLTLAECMSEFERLKKVNAEMMGAKGEKAAPKRKQTKVNRSRFLPPGRPLGGWA